MVGGAVVTQDYADSIGVDIYARRLWPRSRNFWGLAGGWFFQAPSPQPLADLTCAGFMLVTE
jgi:hypothetical protein